MATSLRSRWEFCETSDWITSVDRAGDGTIFVGSRAGDLWVVNQHGSPIGYMRLDGWVGALKLIEPPVRAEGKRIAPYLMAGTKRGTFTCFQAHVAADEAQLTELASFNAGNTLREIDSWSDGNEVLVAAGSEDRHVYLARLSDLTAGEGEERVRKVGVNGWIRCVAFCRNPAGDGPAIAAGCGDKHMYFLGDDDFDGADDTELRKVPVHAKVHCVVGDPSSATVFCASDARRLSVIGWTGKRYEVIEDVPVPHRVTRMTFADDERRNLLAACEDGNIYLFDTVERRLTSYLPVGERVFSLRGEEGNGSGEILIGKAYGRLTCCFYASEPGIPEFSEAPRGETLAEFASNEPAALARIMLFGPIRQAIELGIGRFIHVTSPSQADGVACVVGTDGGDVVVLRLEKGRGQIEHRESFENLRVWAVDATWLEPGKLQVFAATSHSNVLSYVVDLRLTPPEIVDRGEIELEDWPREIRAVAGTARGDARRTLICCENGDLQIHGDKDLRFNTGQILRSGYARVMDDGYDILTGSDDCLITRFRNDVEQWRYPADDRVREALIDDGECVAVSEDRYLYVLADDGKVRWRFRFPHRALCVDINFDHEGARQYVVGCGDGCVYFVDEDGVQAGYEFPDRIRDVKLLEGGDLAVACEDGYLYLAPTLPRFLSEYYSDRQGALIDERVLELRAQVRDVGLEAIGDLEPEERLLLLRHFGDWFTKPDSDMTMALIDAAAVDVLERDHIYLHYIFARALVDASLRVNLAAGRSRIAEHLQTKANNPFVVHALLSTIGTREVGAVWPHELQVLTDTIIVNVPLTDEWISEELVRHLHRGGFFSLAVGGFDQYFRTVRIQYNTLARIFDVASDIRHAGLQQTPLGQVLSYVQSPRRDKAEFDRVVALLAEEATIPMVREGMELLSRLMWDEPSEQRPLTEIKSWIHARIGNDEVVAEMISLLERHEAKGGLESYGMALLGEVLEGRLHALDPRVSGLEYLSIMLVRGFVLGVAARHAAAGGDPVTA